MSDEINTLQMYIKEREKWKKQEGSLEIGYQIIKDKIRDLYDIFFLLRFIENNSNIKKNLADFIKDNP